MPHTIAENLERLKNAKTAIKNAILGKGGTVSSTDGFEDFPTDIASIPSSGIEPKSPKDVNFYDYDGTCVYSYTTDEFLALTEMPANPVHSGLTSQGWNWSLSDAKDYVGNYGRLIIGQMYITSDGKTRIYITLEDGRLSPVLGLCVNGSVDVDWGDETAHNTMTGTSLSTILYQSHTYELPGNYVIALTVTGTFSIKGTNNYSTLISKGSGTADQNRAYRAAVTKVEFGNNISSLQGDSLRNLTVLSSVTLPLNITSIAGAFQFVTGLRYICIPSSISVIGSYTFYSSSNLEIVSIPKSITITSELFRRCSRLQHICIPDKNTSIPSMCFNETISLLNVTITDNITNIVSNAFNGCYALANITFPTVLSSIGATSFSSCFCLGFIKFKPTTPPVIANSNAWTGIPTDCYVLVPLNTLNAYINTTNMLDNTTYLYLCFAKYNTGVTLPTTSTDGYNLTWYATKEDARNEVSAITVGNGKEIYARGVAV